NHERMLLEGERELEEVHQKLDRVTFDLRKSEALARVISETLKDTIVTFNSRDSFYRQITQLKTCLVIRLRN
ncbi:hypothetical protein ACWGPW_29200, partial [Paenibacillus chitinolyticus]